MLAQIHRLITTFLFDPLDILHKWKAIPSYVKNIIVYNKMNSQNDRFKITLKHLYFNTKDKYKKSGTAIGHYFHQDIWAAKNIYDSNVDYHVDVASRIDGFVGHLLVFCNVKYVDIRPLDGKIEGLTYIKGSITDLPFESNSIKSLSSLHVIEHIGLGRYGDPIDPKGYEKSVTELSRVLSNGGRLYLGTPVGREVLAFDAHRVFNAGSIIDIFNLHGLQLKEFSLIDDMGISIIKNANPIDANNCKYGCGLFVFEKP